MVSSASSRWKQEHFYAARKKRRRSSWRFRTDGLSSGTSSNCAEQGMPLEEAVVDAGAVRFRPMLLTAAALVVGAGVVFFDPIFQGLAISLMAGEVASTLLSRMAVPVLYYISERGGI
jgi:Cu/Ag efflux pump CusA